jgi:hypothetical protein
MTDLSRSERAAKYIAHSDAMTRNSIVFGKCDPDSEVIRIDADGFHYRGRFIEDAGEAHRLLVEFLRREMPQHQWQSTPIPNDLPEDDDDHDPPSLTVAERNPNF